LDEGEDAASRFADFANEEPCPALDPETGNCELYESRPMTCRVFGPPVRTEDGLGVCELCYHGASDEEIAACEMKPDPDDLESALVKEVEAGAGVRGDTIIAFCLAVTEPPCARLTARADLARNLNSFPVQLIPEKRKARRD
jgi:hypothetical protein